MLYCVSKAEYPMKYVSSGKLVSEDGFIHPRRNLETFVFILVQEGTLHITQGLNNYDVGENEFIVLFPDTIHYGYKKSEEKLSYYWTHFYVQDPEYRIHNKGKVLRSSQILNNDIEKYGSYGSDIYLLQEYGKVTKNRRLVLLFNQLLDIAKRGNYYATWNCHYALSVLLMEFTTETYLSVKTENTNMSASVLRIMEWIRTHCDQPLTVQEIANRFNYHPTYLTGLFKKNTGYTIINFINRSRIMSAKNLLMDNENTIQFIAHQCGFSDEKYFMRIFKKVEGITPSEYRKAFSQQKINKK